MSLVALAWNLRLRRRRRGLGPVSLTAIAWDLCLLAVAVAIGHRLLGSGWVACPWPPLPGTYALAAVVLGWVACPWPSLPGTYAFAAAVLGWVACPWPPLP